MMHRTLLFGVWGLPLWATLSLRDLPWLQTHGICGPWGCGPTVPALLAVHGGWMVLLLPFAILLRRREGRRGTQAFCRGLLGCGLGGIAAVGLYEAATWLPTTSAWGRGYFLHRWAFAVVTLTDVPLLQLVALGSVLILLPPRCAESTSLRATQSASTGHATTPRCGSS